MSMAFNILLLLFNLYLRALDFSESSIGQLLSLQQWGAFLIALPASLYMARGNIRASLILSSIATALGFFLLTASSGAALLGLSVLAIGSFTSVFRIAAGPFIMQNSSPEERPFAFSLNFALLTGAGFLGSLAGGFTRDFLAALLENEALAYRLALLIFGGGCAALAFIPFYRLHFPEQKGDFPVLQLLAGCNHRLFAKLLLPSLLIGFGSGLTIPFVNLYFKLEWGLSDGMIGTWFGLARLTTFVGMIVSPLLVRRFHIVRVIVISQLASIPFMLAMGYLELFPVVVTAFLLRQVLMNMHSPMNSQLRMELVAPEEQSLINALRMVGWTGMRAFAAFLGGRIIEHYSFRLSFTLTSLIYLIAALLFYIFFKHVDVRRSR
jgi:MFS family permease